ncbi:MAG: DUF881 domain-containing protein [Clostridia bacterium]|nr:DUF881 domain-containing protein [Clostridia bacterium]
MRAKVIMCLTIGIICILLVSVVFVQVKTVDVIENSGVSTMRESELRSELASWKAKNEEIENTIKENEESIEEYKTQTQTEQGTLGLLNQDLQKAYMSLGYTNVKGQGIEITVSDGNKRVGYGDLLVLVNELKYAGAEAISINDERIVANTDIVDVQSKFILVNTQRVMSPYVVKAIGDSKYLESAINIKGGIKDELEAEGKNISYVLSDEILINKYNGNLEINYGE